MQVRVLSGTWFYRKIANVFSFSVQLYREARRSLSCVIEAPVEALLKGDKPDRRTSSSLAHRVCTPERSCRVSLVGVDPIDVVSSKVIGTDRCHDRGETRKFSGCSNGTVGWFSSRTSTGSCCRRLPYFASIHKKIDNHTIKCLKLQLLHYPLLVKLKIAPIGDKRWCFFSFLIRHFFYFSLSVLSVLLVQRTIFSTVPEPIWFKLFDNEGTVSEHPA